MYCHCHCHSLGTHWRRRILPLPVLPNYSYCIHGMLFFHIFSSSFQFRCLGAGLNDSWGGFFSKTFHLYFHAQSRICSRQHLIIHFIYWKTSFCVLIYFLACMRRFWWANLVGYFANVGMKLWLDIFKSTGGGICISCTLSSPLSLSLSVRSR